MASSSRDTSQFDTSADNGSRKPRAPQSPPSSFWYLSPSEEADFRKQKDRVRSDRKEWEDHMRHGHRRHGHRSHGHRNHGHRRHSPDQEKEEYRPSKEGRREPRRSDPERDEPRRPEEERKTARRSGQEKEKARRHEEENERRRPSGPEKEEARRYEEDRRRPRRSDREEKARYPTEPQQESHWSARVLTKAFNKISEGHEEPRHVSERRHGRPKRRHYE